MNIVCVLTGITVLSVSHSNTIASEKKIAKQLYGAKILECKKDCVIKRDGRNKFPVVDGVKTYKKVVALTFDDGPDPRYTPRILDILQKYNAKATFFVVGQNVELHSDILQKEIVDGDEIGNHTFSHPNLMKLSFEGQADEINKNQEEIYNKVGITPNLFRPPYSRCHTSLCDKLYNKKGMVTVLWGLCFEQGKESDPVKRADWIIKKTKPGDIIVMHDGRLNRDNSVIGAEKIVEKLSEEGYKFVTISEMLKMGKIR